MARHHCDVSSELCSPGAKPRSWAPPLVTTLRYHNQWWSYAWANWVVARPLPPTLFYALSAGHAMEWNGMKLYRMDWKENFGMENGRCSEWNGKEDLKNGMENRVPYFLHIFKLATNYKVMP